MPIFGWDKPESRASTDTSVVGLLSQLAPEERAEFIAGLTDEEALEAIYSWRLWARPNQVAPEACECHNGNWNSWLVLAGRGWGKEFSLQTALPTPSGWTTMGDIQLGDLLFDEQGNICAVENIFDQFPKQLYRISFSDGTWIDAGAEHQWVTWTHSDRKSYLRSTYEAPNRFPRDWTTWRPKRTTGQAAYNRIDIAQLGLALDAVYGGLSLRKAEKEFGITRSVISRSATTTRLAPTPQTNLYGNGPRIRTTQQIIDTFTYGKRGDLNHCIPLTAPLILPEMRLPLDPYVLGYWLGDGSSNDGVITCAEIDQPNLYQNITEFSPHPVNSSPITVATYGLRVKLGELGVLRNKHVPRSYLRASASQRLALLQGLMDSDGYAGNSHVEFCNTNRALAEAVVELARSLGEKPRMVQGDSKLNGQSCGPKWRVHWKPTTNPFRLLRKAERVVLLGAQSLRNHHRMITNYEEIPREPTRCLTVNSTNSMFLAGSGMVPTHNTRVGSEWIRARQETGKFGRFAFVGRSAADVRDTIVEGESGIINVSPPWNKPIYYPSKRRVEWPNGAFGLMFSADEPEQLRGPQHDSAYCDELAAWKYREAYDQLMLGLRLGTDPRVVITTTPKPTPIIRELFKDPYTHVTPGSTYDNLPNLAQAFANTIIKKYEGTRLGRQELLGILLEDVEGALWNYAMFEERRYPEHRRRVVVAIDPSVAEEGRGNEAGIIVACIDTQGVGYVLADRSLHESPMGWAKQAVQAYKEFRADRIIAEANNGGAIVEALIRTIDPNVSYKAVHAARGKLPRAEPVVSLYEQNRIFHAGEFTELEDQLTTWTPNDSGSPDRLDALVWAFTELMVEPDDTPLSILGFGKMQGWGSQKKRAS